MILGLKQSLEKVGVTRQRSCDSQRKRSTGEFSGQHWYFHLYLRNGSLVPATQWNYCGSNQHCATLIITIELAKWKWSVLFSVFQCIVGIFWSDNPLHYALILWKELRISEVYLSLAHWFAFSTSGNTDRTLTLMHGFAQKKKHRASRTWALPEAPVN